MKARLFVVNNETKIQTLKNMEVSVFVPEPIGKFWNKTLIDIISDLNQVEIGDYIFLWESGSEMIYGVFRSVSKPFFRYDNSNDIFRIKIDFAYTFEKPIEAYDVINNPYMKNKLWNIIGKKVAGKARASIPVTIEEAQFLIQSLIDKNNNLYDFKKDFTTLIVKNEIKFDYINEYFENIPESIASYDYKPLKIRNGNLVKYEKALKGILNTLFRDKEKDSLDSLGIKCENVVWNANYLPYGFERSEIDYMVMESIDGMIINRIDVIELMKGTIDLDHINKCLKYGMWVKSSVSNNNNIVRPILICGDCSKNSLKLNQKEKIKKALIELPKLFGFEKIDVYTYSIDNGINFSKYEVISDE